MSEPLKSGDVVTGENGERWLLGEHLAYQGCGEAGPMCSQIDGRCVGWHCSVCDAPCSSMGHSGCREATA